MEYGFGICKYENYFKEHYGIVINSCFYVNQTNALLGMLSGFKVDSRLRGTGPGIRVHVTAVSYLQSICRINPGEFLYNESLPQLIRGVKSTLNEVILLRTIAFACSLSIMIFHIYLLVSKALAFYLIKANSLRQGPKCPSLCPELEMLL